MPKIWYIFIMENKEKISENLLDLKERIELLYKEIESLKKENKSLKDENNYLRELHYLKLKEQYARKTEKLKELGYITLFDEIELNKEKAEIEEKIETLEIQTTVKEHTRTKRVNLVNEEEHSFPVEEKHITMEETDNIKDMNCDEIVRKLCHIPEKIYIKEIHIHQYQKTDENGETTIIRPEYTHSIFGKAMVDESFINSIIYKNIVMSLPLYRQEQALKQMGINLTRQNMSNYIYKAFEIYEPIIKRIKAYVLDAEVLRCDETSHLVIEINSKEKAEAKSKSYIWSVSTGKSYKPAIYYQLGPGRDKEVAKKLFENKKEKYLMTDNYAAYKNLSNVTNCFCLVHVNRYFKKLIDKKTPKDAISIKVVKMISNIFHQDNQILEGCHNDYNLIKEKRIEIIKPLLDDLYRYLEITNKDVSPKSGLGRAFQYALSSKDGIYNILKDGRLELNNNYSEREAIKPWVIRRKNSLFSNTSKGATVTCGLFTLLRTAIENGLKPFEYLQYLALNLPENYSDKFDYSKFLPWADSIPDSIKNK